ncbi:hypothetical protein DYB28_004486 [Aphanomyces astaci]|uniref:Uncharacterized protein n=1 Tax=Aphanomyces astaci TaxID=112090 RepID=A0A9X8HD88_APHAT|nr:hypothetical protein DYB28_004486 [Aphanomyces astaci]
MASAEPVGSVVELHQPLHVLKHKVPFRNLLMGLFVFYAVSFAITWYRVWWNSLAGILVAAVGLLWLTIPSTKDGIWLELLQRNGLVASVHPGYTELT